MSRREPSPPAFFRWLLEQTLPPDLKSEALLGDLHEEYLTRAARGRWVAGVRYAWDALGVAVRCGWQARARRGVGTSTMGNVMEQIGINLRYSLRRLARSPVFTIVAIASLGIGIGANTAMFSLVNAVVIRDLPFSDPESLVDVYLAQEGFSHGTLSYPDYEDLVDASEGLFSGVSGSMLTMLQADLDGGVETVPAESVTGNYFSLVGVQPAVGRLFTDEDHVAPGAHPVVVLGHGYWQRRFAGDPEVVGSELRLSGRPFTVIGVAPENYPGNLRGLVPDVFVPIMMYDELQGSGTNTLEARGNQSLFAKARLAPGATFAQGEAVVDRLSQTLREEYPRYWQSTKAFVLVPTRDVIMNPMVDRVLVPAAGMIMTVVGLVLLIACANLASFLLARAADRRKEIAVRLAMGARRRTLVGQLMTETLLLSLLGGLAGVAIAAQSLRILVGADLPLPLPITLDLSLDTTVLAFSVLVTALAGVLFGLAPAVQSTNPDVAPTLRDETAGGGRARGTVMRNLLVSGQVAVSVVLLVAAGLFLRSLEASSRVDVGFGDRPTGVLQMLTPVDRYSEEESMEFYRRLEERIAQLPGVEAVGRAGNLHLNQLSTQTVRVNVDGIDPPAGMDFHSVDRAAIDEGFLDAAGIPLVEGRNISLSDDAGGEPVAVVNETFARRFFPDGDALGRTIRVEDEDTRVVGVSRDTKVRQLGEEPRPFVYVSIRQDFDPFSFVLARTSGDAGALALDMFTAARSMDPEIMIFESTTVERHLSIMLVARELGAWVVAGFAVLALLLASLGLYGVVSFAVSRRVHEVGIRLSLGAESGSVVWMLTSGGLRLVLLGGVVGLLLAAGLSQLLSRLLYGVPPLDPLTFVAVPVVLGSVAALAAWIPARRASRIDPVTALRSD
ncbi:MAG: ADOP family duplicated permease [Gemmatimonadota bacterium]|jgi:predicted permease